MCTKQITMIAICLCAMLTTKAEDREAMSENSTLTRGYRAFVEGDILWDCGLAFTTTHGYQFDPHFFAGAGISQFALIGGYGTALHADLRYDNILNQRNTPYLDMRFHFVNDEFSFNPTIGYRFGHFNLHLGYWTLDDDGFFTLGLGLDFGGRKH